MNLLNIPSRHLTMNSFLMKGSQSIPDKNMENLAFKYKGGVKIGYKYKAIAC